MRKADVLVTLGCILAVGLSAASALRLGAPPREKLRTWMAARATRNALKRDWATLANGPARLGHPSQQARMVVFLDFQCPYCAAEWPRLDSLLATGPAAAITVRNLPLPMHRAADGAARASICATAQGRFAQMADRLFTSRQWQQDQGWTREAQAAGVPDLGAFARCLRDSSTARQLAADQALARRFHILGTPTFVNRGRIVPGAIDLPHLRLLLALETR